MNPRLPDAVCRQHAAHFGRSPQHMAYAPGRVEILGNHTDYNGGLTLSAAIDAGICAAVSRKPEPKARLLAMDLQAKAEFALPVAGPPPAAAGEATQAWANYILGVAHGLPIGAGTQGGFDLTFSGDIPRGAGLSSSAALELAAALALAALTGAQPPPLELARLCQRAENEFAGAQCGLLDQLSSLFGAENALVAIDFQSLAVKNIPLPGASVFLIADTQVRHALVDSAYNDRRAQCEAAARFCAGALGRPIKNLRAVTLAEFREIAPEMDPIAARHARHVLEENQRVQDAMAALQNGATAEFGRLMYASHHSSRDNFENSCPELDHLVDQAKTLPAVIGARLSGGGFGGSVVVMAPPDGASEITAALQKSFQNRFQRPCPVRAIRPSAGARLL